MEWVLLLVGAWLAASVSGAAGFGGALLLLPVLTHVVGAEAAVPILTVAQLLGNVSRAGFGFREIRWRPAFIFSAGAIPAAVVGAFVFIELPNDLVQQLIGVFLLLVIVYRHTRLGRVATPEAVLPPAGALVGFLSAVVGSAGPVGAAIFLGLRLPPASYVASEAVTASLIHFTKTLVYGRYELVDASNLALGLLLGSTMVLGSWTGRRLIQSASPGQFGLLVEILLAVSALPLILGL